MHPARRSLPRYLELRRGGGPPPALQVRDGPAQRVQRHLVDVMVDEVRGGEPVVDDLPLVELDHLPGDLFQSTGETPDDRAYRLIRGGAGGGGGAHSRLP